MSKIELINKILETYLSVLGNSKTYYVSTPMTTGREYFENIINGIDNEQSRLNLYNKNVCTARHSIEEIRSYLNCRAIIEPTSFSPTTLFSQEDWLGLWERVIRKHVHSIIFLDGWEYSHGCVTEMSIALKYGISLCDRSVLPMTHGEIQFKILQSRAVLEDKFEDIYRLHMGILDLLRTLRLNEQINRKEV